MGRDETGREEGKAEGQQRMRVSVVKLTIHRVLHYTIVSSCLVPGRVESSRAPSRHSLVSVATTHELSASVYDVSISPSSMTRAYQRWSSGVATTTAWRGNAMAGQVCKSQATSMPSTPSRVSVGVLDSVGRQIRPTPLRPSIHSLRTVYSAT